MSVTLKCKVHSYEGDVTPCNLGKDQIAGGYYHEEEYAATFVATDVNGKAHHICPYCMFLNRQRIMCVGCEVDMGSAVLGTEGYDVNGLCDDCADTFKSDAESNYEDAQEELDNDRLAKKLKFMQAVWE